MRLVRCPRCGSEGFQPCQTTGGWDRPDHVARIKASQTTKPGVPLDLNHSTGH
jgi:hypothetical protein